MRTKTLTAAVLAAAAALLLTACAQSPERQSGAPVPSTSPTTTTPTTTPTSPAAAPTSSGGTATTTLVLGPTGYGSIRLGMTKEQALATGLLAPLNNADGCAQAEVRGAPKGGWVMFSPQRGVAAIDAWSTLKTAEGLRIGMTATEARRIYPDWTIVDGTVADGRHFAKVPGNDKARYRIGTKAGKIQEVTLQLVSQDCYE